MPSYSTEYRHKFPDYYAREKEATIQRLNDRYATDPEFRQKKKDLAKARYQKLKESKASISI